MWHKHKAIAALCRGKGGPRSPKPANEVWVMQRKGFEWLDRGTPGQRVGQWSEEGRVGVAERGVEDGGSGVVRGGWGQQSGEWSGEWRVRSTEWGVEWEWRVESAKWGVEWEWRVW